MKDKPIEGASCLQCRRLALLVDFNRQFLCPNGHSFSVYPKRRTLAQALEDLWKPRQ